MVPSIAIEISVKLLKAQGRMRDFGRGDGGLNTPNILCVHTYTVAD